jgi:hypothetical protein
MVDILAVIYDPPFNFFHCTSCAPLTFSISSHVGPDAFGMAVTRRLARAKEEV